MVVAYAWETDFLLAYESTTGEVKDFLLQSFLPHENERLAFEKIICSRSLRTRFELEFNGAFPFEEFETLRDDGYCRVSGIFRSDKSTRRMVPFQTITATKKHLKSVIRVPGLIDPSRFFTPLIDAYLCRDSGKGIVVTRAFADMAMRSGDIGLLAAIVDPQTGERAFPDAREEVELQGWQLINSDKTRKNRITRLRAAPYLRGGVEIHDLSYMRPLTDLLPRQIEFDIDAFAFSGSPLSAIVNSQIANSPAKCTL